MRSLKAETRDVRDALVANRTRQAGCRTDPVIVPLSGGVLAAGVTSLIISLLDDKEGSRQYSMPYSGAVEAVSVIAGPRTDPNRADTSSRKMRTAAPDRVIQRHIGTVH